MLEWRRLIAIVAHGISDCAACVRVTARAQDFQGDQSPMCKPDVGTVNFTFRGSSVFCGDKTRKVLLKNACQMHPCETLERTALSEQTILIWTPELRDIRRLERTVDVH